MKTAKRRDGNRLCYRCGRKLKYCDGRHFPIGRVAVGIILLLVGITVLQMSRVRPFTRTHVENNPPEMALDWRDTTVLKDCDAKLRQLITEHPDRAIRDTLNNLIVRGVVLKNYQPDEKSATGRILATVQLINVEGRGLTPVMQFDPNVLLDLGISDQAKQLIIRHEYVHLRQLLDGRHPPETFMGRRASAPWLIAEVREMLDAEWEAYHLEAERAKAWGWLDAIPLISTYRDGSRVLARAIAAEYAASPMLQDYKIFIYGHLDSLAKASPAP